MLWAHTANSILPVYYLTTKDMLVVTGAALLRRRVTEEEVTRLNYGNKQQML